MRVSEPGEPADPDDPPDAWAAPWAGVVVALLGAVGLAAWALATRSSLTIGG